MILSDKDEAAYFYNDLVNLLGEAQILFFPSSFRRSVQFTQTDNGNIILRNATLTAIDRFAGSAVRADEFLAVVTYPEALIERVVTPEQLHTNTLQINKNEKIGIDFIHEVLTDYDFEKVDFVYEPGQFSIRGGIVDIFSFADNVPYRIDFFGDQIESIRSFDIESQLSVRQVDSIAFLPDLQQTEQKNQRMAFIDFIPHSATIGFTDMKFIADRMNEDFHIATDTKEISPESSFTTGSYLIEKIPEFTTLEFSQLAFFPGADKLTFNTSLQPAFNKNFTLLGETMVRNQSEGYTNVILSDSEKQIERLEAIFRDVNGEVRFISLLKSLHEGFIHHDLRLCCFTDHQIFERYHKYRLKSYFAGKALLSIKELKGLKPGDFVVHIDHGIGRFGGLDKIEVNGKVQEAVRLVYKDNDILYVSIHSLHRISKYKGKDDDPPRIYKLGSGAWQNLKQKTKGKIKDIARDLIALYAKRKSQEGFRFSVDTYLQEELEASFIFEDTPDQITSTKAVKEDMESVTPMDRLVCGDVGFGKTEVAIRAAFKAVTDSKQVGILVPTTILALQHYTTFTDRLKDFPCSIDYISRLKKTKDQKESLKKLEEGKTDIIIGTHSLLGKDVRFKDLGLLIVDEEQKFGVAAKEKLRAIKLNVDTLTLTATPIPRTLQFSLMGARDLSIINTPPPNRHPIVTELHTFNDDIIREGINFEVSRGGQVFFIHNRIQNIVEMEALVNTLCPAVKTVVAHGQLEGPKLERIMLDFIRGDYDVLVSTNIIESGLDIPNANTIFINNAHHFGLSDLHQLRGRVGRSNKKAFCYLLTPPLYMVTPEAKRRLKAIEEFSDLGSGFNIALQDLDIRGAGNLLGAEQSGFIADIGFETYNQILNEAIRELRDNEYKTVFHAETPENRMPDDHTYADDCQIDTDFLLLFPDTYIQNTTEKLNLYRELDNIQNEKELEEFERRLADRFGPLPEESAELLKVVRLRWIAVRLGFEKIILKSNVMVGYFISNPDSPYFRSPVFGRILSFVQEQPGLFRMKEINDKLTLTVDKITGISDAIGLLEKIDKDGKKE